jgi:hypothetical protein
MTRSAAKTPAEYLASLPADRRAAIAAVRDVVNQYMPKGYDEVMNWGAITWEVPVSRFCYVSLAAHKNFCTLDLMGAYANSKQFIALKQAFAKARKKFDMGKSCLHFNRAEDLALEAIGEVIASYSPDQWIAVMESSRKKPR